MMLAQQSCNRQAHIAGARNGDLVILHVIYSSGPFRTHPIER